MSNKKLEYEFKKLQSTHYPIAINLLKQNDLLWDEVDDALVILYGLFYRDELVAVSGLEIYNECALLRSVCVADTSKTTGLGSHIVTKILQEAKNLGLKYVYLLTMTAEGFFKKLGFTNINREEAPLCIKFKSSCPGEAVCQYKELL